jgi:hypothetical protein
MMRPDNPGIVNGICIPTFILLREDINPPALSLEEIHFSPQLYFTLAV